jgi:hypothetical protein
VSDTWDSAPIAAATTPAPSPWEAAPLAGSNPSAKAAVSANDNAEEAARAHGVAKRTGIPATVVQSDLPGYTGAERTESARRAAANPAIARYIENNPIAPSASSDDWDGLEEVSAALKELHPELFQRKVNGGLIGAVPEISALAGTPQGRDKLYNAALALPKALASGILDFFETPGKVASGEVNLTTPEGLDQGISLGIGLALGSGRPRVGAAESVKPTGISFDDFMHTLEGMRTRKEIDDFLASRQPGPPGAMLQITKAETGATALDQAIEVAQESKTKQRTPDLFADFANAHDAGEVHIDAGKVLELYEKEGKVPAESDGLFGFVPDLVERMQTAAATGGEISIPVGSYIAHVDPTVHEGLKDSVRLHNDGVTLEEAKEAQKAVDSFDPEAPKEPDTVIQNDNPVISEAATQTTKEKENLYLNGLFKDAKSIGITEPEFKRYSDKIERAEAYVLERAVKLNKSRIAEHLSGEWKRNEAEIRTEITSELTNSGAFAAEKFFRDNKITLAHERAAEVADELAPLFGFDNGQDLLAGLQSIETERAASGKGPQTQLRDAIKERTDTLMEERYGRLPENIAQEAREIALADHSFDIMAEEVALLAKAAGVTPPLSRTEMVYWAKGRFEASNMSEAANYEKHQRAVTRNGREAEKALLKGDFVEALQAKQKQMLAATLAKESLALQRLVDTTERKIDRLSSEQTIKSIDQQHLEQIREMLQSVGVQQIHVPTLPTAPLADFVNEAEGQLAVAPWLFKNPPAIRDMTVTQFREFTDSLKSMEHVGRWATKLENAQGEAELQNVVFDAVKELQRFPFKDQPTNNPSFGQRLTSFGRKIVGMHLLVERALDYTDKFNPHGPLTEWLDRPLRDANVKEIQLTEQVVRDLKDLRQHTTPEILENIPNALIPDALDKTGFMKMTRQNLRVLMLNMGNWSNMRKLVEGFGVNEADLRRFVDSNAKASDVAWVNGIWKVFDRLKPEADAVQTKDTGVPVDTIEGMPWDIKGGKLNGGYYPLSYDPYNSDITGHIARPLFDRGYFSAATPHGYTKQRTEYSGAIDLSGNMLASKLRGMVHDIAFRLPVRNANKLIENQEFRTAMAQYWGKEVADLLPGWLRDIANSHNIDDNYAQGLVRASSLIRQNVVSTLIAYNPGTFIKHGFTAAVMSADRIGLGPLLGSLKNMGLSGAAKNLKDIAWKADRIPDEAFMESFRAALDQGQRGENARQFVMDSSAVMRARQRQYDENIRGAVDQITNAGLVQTAADFRQRQMLYQRMAVTFSDQMSAMPTWLAAYKKAYASGESHADAVFIADKEVSRAHGSGFVGDKPLVSRAANTATGEFSRWFTTLYNFWNHQQNNQFQLAWDAAARFRGNPGGEPGANAASISRRLALIMGIIFIEEMAGPAKDEHGHGLLTQLAFATTRFLGGGYIGLREVTNGLAHGYEPSTGMIGTLFKGGTEVAKDLAKATGYKAGVAKDWIRNTMTAIGFATGVGGTQLGRTGQFGYDVARGADRPRTFNDYRQGLRTGHSKARKFK